MPYTYLGTPYTTPQRGSSVYCAWSGGYNCVQWVNIPPYGWLHKPLCGNTVSRAAGYVFIFTWLMLVLYATSHIVLAASLVVSPWVGCLAAC